MKELSTRPQAVLSRNLVVAGLLELMLEQPFTEITVSQICERGGVSRQTFYRNFETKEEIILYHVDTLVQKHMNQVVGVMDRDLEQFFAHLPFSQQFLKLLKENNLMYLLRDAVLPLIRNFMQSSVFVTPLLDRKYDEYYAHYLADLMISLLETWTETGFHETGEELYQLMRSFLAGSGTH